MRDGPTKPPKGVMAGLLIACCLAFCLEGQQQRSPASGVVGHLLLGLLTTSSASTHRHGGCLLQWLVLWGVINPTIPQIGFIIGYCVLQELTAT